MKKYSLLPLLALPLVALFITRRSGAALPGRPEGLPKPGVEPDDLITPETDPMGAFTFDQWVKRTDYGGPQLSSDDLQPSATTRKLTPYERWMLEPYFYVADLDLATIRNGQRPARVAAGIELPKTLHAVTETDFSITFPHEPRSFLDRYWLSLLAHELYHVGQIRIGATMEEGWDAMVEHGYWQSPIEVSARWKQRQVFEGLTTRARAFVNAHP